MRKKRPFSFLSIRILYIEMCIVFIKKRLIKKEKSNKGIC